MKPTNLDWGMRIVGKVEGKASKKHESKEPSLKILGSM